MTNRLSALLIGSIAAIVFGQIASAADLPAKAPVYKAPPPPPALYNWTGFYVGGNIGYGWGDVDHNANPLPSPVTFNASPFAVGLSPDGVLGGVQVGYNWQTGAVVYGIETDFQFSGIDDTATLTPLSDGAGVPVAGWNSVATTKLKYLGTLRARLGTTVTPETLLYLTGGLAYGRVENSSLTTYTPSPPFTYDGSTSSTKFGWTIGAGLEQGFGRWTAKIEYLYVDLANADYTAFPLAPNPPFRVGFDVDNLTISIARVGLNYRF